MVLVFAHHCVGCELQPNKAAVRERQQDPRTHRLKHSIHVAIVGPSHQAWASNQPCTDVVNNVAIEIGHHHDIELLGPGHQLWSKEGAKCEKSRVPRAGSCEIRWVHYLHGGIVHNHVLKGDLGVAGSHLPAALEEEPITQLPRGR